MPRYVFDTSALIDGWVRFYPKSVFPCVWIKFAALVAAGAVQSPSGVLGELKPKSDSLYDWAKGQQNLFVEEDEEIQKAGREVLSRFPRLVPAHSAKSLQDPFVIGFARLERGIVVTGEKPARYNNNEIKIPDVCNSLNIECIDFLTLMKREGWVFE